jgi:hypothetical protein
MSDTSTVKKIFNLETPDQKITTKTQMGGHQRGNLPNEDKKLDSLLQDREKWKEEVIEKAKTFSN